MKQFLLLMLILNLGAFLPGCEPEDTAPKDQHAQVSEDLPEPQKPYIPILQGPQVAQSLDISRVWILVKEARTALDLEYLLNHSGLNNLDVNQDQRVDYLNLEAFQEAGQRGFVLYTYENETPLKIATLTLTPNGNRVEIMLTGHPNHYGDNYRHFKNLERSEVPLTDWLYQPEQSLYQPAPKHLGKPPNGFVIQGKVPLEVYQARLKAQELKLDLPQ